MEEDAYLSTTFYTPMLPYMLYSLDALKLERKQFHSFKNPQAGSGDIQSCGR